ncbi:Aldo-keto reductase family 1 member C13 [Psilocybe cubensis]|uniref:Aldo-keto reductase family 1 member C13 n=1 Tax=Psilocybe cubensis TaxID=181762 RepID=A0ACB8HA48_PSICU|nr:Aldo-keto reductase family 1 member C13 [Psilocybe cubensis]KAH9484878.1 Aldo-keto reductase family 1 member C13 [Psilocybe cubensis]
MAMKHWNVMIWLFLVTSSLPAKALPVSPQYVNKLDSITFREDLVGEALLQLQKEHDIKREHLFVQTKFTPIGGQDATQPIPYNPSDSISKQITLEAWRTLTQLQDEGKVRLIGVSNTYDVRILAALQRVRPVQVVQNRWYEGNDWDPKVLNYCKESGIMYQSFWTLSGSPSLLAHPSLLQIAKASKMTAPQTVYKIAQLEGIIPLSGTTDENHMRQDVSVEELSFFEGSSQFLEDVRKFIKE